MPWQAILVSAFILNLHVRYVAHVKFALDAVLRGVSTVNQGYRFACKLDGEGHWLIVLSI